MSQAVENKKYKIGHYAEIKGQLYRRDEKSNRLIKVTKRKRIVTKPYMTKKRKNVQRLRDFKRGMVIVFLWLIGSGLVAFAETTNNFQIYGDAVEKANALVTSQPETVSLVASKEEGGEVTSQALDEVDYSDIPYVEKTKAPVKDQIKAIATEECAALDLGDRCATDTFAIAWKETRFKPGANGDNGNSWGYFQIYRVAHPEITIAQAKDIDFSTR